MAGEIISESLLVIASVVLAGILFAAIVSSISSIGSALTSMSTLLSKRMVTSLKIVYATNTSSTEVVFYLQNIGEEPVYISTSTIYFGKLYSLQPIGYSSSTPPSWTSQTTILNPGETAEITITLSSPLQANQLYEILFVTSSGYEVNYVFEVM